MGEVVKLARDAREPHIGDVLTWDGQGWVPDLIRSRWSVIQAVNSPMMASVREGPGIDVVRRAGGMQVGLGGDTVLVYDANWVPIAEFAPTETGLKEALDAAGSGDVVLLPAGEIAIDDEGITLGAGVALVGLGEASKLAITGVLVGITQAADAVCANFELSATSGDAGVTGIDARFVRAVVANVRIKATSSSGDSHGVRLGVSGVDADELPTIYGCPWIQCEGETFDMYGVYVDPDTAGVVMHSRVAGTTVDIGGTGTVYVYGVACDPAKVEASAVEYMSGDRAAYSVEDYHAADIEAGELSRHTPIPTGVNDLILGVQGDVSPHWNRVSGPTAERQVFISGGNPFIPVWSLLGVDKLSDVDTVTDSPSKSEVLKWNGSDWVPAAYDYNFTFSIASFSDGEATTQLIGTGVWEAADAVIFAATYNNGPPTTADVKMSINGAGYNDVGHMDSPAYTAGKNYDGAINYPAAKDQYLRFRLDATDGVDPDVEYETAIYFRNHIRWGVASKNAGFTEADVEGLANNAISNDQTRSMSLNPGVGEYLVFAFPSSYTSIPDGDDYEDDGGTGFRFDSIACAFKAPETVSITNSAGYTENYKVYASEESNLGSHTLVTSTSNTQINPLYYGKTVKTDTFLEADIEGLANSEITNDNTQVWDSVTTGSGEYMLFAFPKRLGIPTFWVGGFEGGFEASETVSVTNSNGWTEDYYAWRSTNSNLGATVVETK